VKPQSLEAARPGRLNSADIAKGIAIILMVYGHTAQGGVHRRWWDASPHVTSVIDFLNAFIYSFHMPVFFFVAGLFIERSLARRGPGAFTLEKIKTILYPYLLWGLITGLSNPFTAAFRSTSQPFSWRTLAWDFLSGDASWFLITLFICLIFALLVIKLPNWARMALALAACYLVPTSHTIVLSAPFQFFPFMVAGMWVGGTRMSRIEKLPRLATWAAFALLFAVQFAIIWLTGETTRWDKFPIGLTGIAMFMLLSAALNGTSCGSVLTWFGEGSLAVFLLAPFIQGASREVILRLLHTTAPLPQLLLPTLLASTIPALLWHKQQQLHIGWLFHWPQRPSVVRLHAEPAAAHLSQPQV
jgi:fucose 4-O-acetylase-like acetyltransferase